MDKYPNINILLNVPRYYLPKAEFVFRTMCYTLRLSPKFYYGLHSEGVHIYYGKANSQRYPIRIYYSDETADFFEQRELYPLENVNFVKYIKEYIPFLFSQNGGIYSLYDDFCVIRKDIIASAFHFLTCWHEFILSSKGMPHGRVDFKQSLQYRWDFTEIPVVDVYCQILHRMVQIFLPEFIRDIRWNETKSFALTLSHDVDYWQYWTTKQILETYQYNLSTLYKRPLNALFKTIGHTIDKALNNNPWNRIRRIIRREEAQNVQSTWFLLAKRDFPDQRQNYLFDVQYKEQVLDLLSQKEIGLHGSPESAFNLEALNAELDNLRQLGFNPTGFRTHYLHFDYQKSFSILEKAGIKYDSTMGYWEHIGYRAGVSFPFYPFNIAENRPFRVLEIPLIVMDTTLLSHKAMNLFTIQAKRRLNKLTKRSSIYQSHISLLWHNTTFDNIDYPFWGGLYWSMIKYAKKRNGWVTSLNHVYDEWVNISY